MSDAIGALRARVQLASPARSEDDLGGAALTWADQGTVWADITAAAVTGTVDYDTAAAITSYRLVIRPRADIRAGWRATWGARVLRVVGVRDDGGSRIELECEEEFL